MDWRFGRLPFSLDPLIAEAKRRARRRRFQLLAVVVIATAAAVAGVTALRAPSVGGVAAELRAGGVMVVGDGIVCTSTHGVFFTPSGGNEIGGPAGACDGGFQVHGLALSRIKMSTLNPGNRSGRVEIKAVYLNGVMTVTGQGLPRHIRPPAPTLSDLRCRVSRGGWSKVRMGRQAAYNLTLSYRPQSDLTARYMFQSHGSTVAAVASTRPARTRRLLGPRMPGHLCVVRSRYDGHTLERTRQRVFALVDGADADEASPVTFGPGRTQPVIEVWTPGLVTPRLRAFLHTVPPGTVRVFPGLRIVPR